jgi:hypothetical protein
MTRPSTVARVAICFLIVCAAASCAPAIPGTARTRPAATKGWEKSSRHKFTEGRNGAKDEYWFDDENAKFRKLADEATDEENQAMERLCKHPWWDEEARKSWVSQCPWFFERIIERIQNHDVTVYCVLKGNNRFPDAVYPKSEAQHDWVRYSKDPRAKPLSFDEYVTDRFGKDHFEVTFAEPKKADPNQRITTPSGKRVRFDVIRVLLDGLDAADKKSRDP